LLSHTLGQYRHASSMAESIGATGVSPETKNFLSLIFDALEQKPVDFKHITTGETVAEQLTTKLKGLTEIGDLEAGRAGFRSLLTEYFGEDIATGIDIDLPGGERFNLRLTDQILDEFAPALYALQSKEMKEASNFVALKASDIARRGYKKVAEMEAATGKKLSHFDIGEIMRHEASMFLENEGLVGTKAGAQDVKERLTRAAAEAREKAMRRRGRIATPLLYGALGTGFLYSLFDRGYADKPLEVPGSPGTSLQMRGAIADGSVLNDGFMRRRPESQQGGPEMPAPPGGQQAPYVPNSVPNRSVIMGNTGRMSVDSVIPEHVDPQMLAERLRYAMPHAQVGVNLTHRYQVPANLEDEL